MSKVQPIPDGKQSATPYLCVRDAAATIEFYKRAFGAVVTMRLDQPDGRVGHAELSIGPAGIMLSDEFPEYSIRSPQTLGGTPVTIHLYVEDVDAIFATALSAGATVVEELKDQFYGDRSGVLLDPAGHRWMFATHTEDVSEDEMQKRLSKLYGNE